MPEVFLNALRIPGDSTVPLVVLHGWRQNLNSLKEVAELVRNGREVHLLDLPGFGNSEVPPADWGTPEYATRLLRYLDEQKIERADFLGHSYGGRLCMYLGFREPTRVSRLVLIDASGVRAQPPLKKRLKLFGVRSLRNVLRFLKQRLGVPWYETWFIPRFASADYKASGPMREVFVRVVNEDYSNDISSILAPTLVLWGALDTETPLAAGEKIASLIPNSSFVPLEGKDHFPFLGAGASLCAYHIKNFYQSHPSGI